MMPQVDSFYQGGILLCYMNSSFPGLEEGSQVTVFSHLESVAIVTQSTSVLETSLFRIQS